MATLLAFVTTDAAISPASLQQALAFANERSFNRLTVDGDMSTNDSLIILANGLAAIRKLPKVRMNLINFPKLLNTF